MNGINMGGNGTFLNEGSIIFQLKNIALSLMVHVSNIYMISTLVCPGIYCYILTLQVFEYAMFGVVLWDMILEIHWDPWMNIFQNCPRK